MERKVLLFGLLQSLSFFVSARCDSNGTSMNSYVDSEIADIAEYAETLEYASANVSLDADGEQAILLPFGDLKTDWKRLQLLRDALPPNSVLKPKFKHLFRFLLIAYKQMMGFAASRESTKRKDTVDNETTVSVPIKADGNIQEVDKKRPITEHERILNSTDPNQQVAATLEEFPATVSSVSPKYDKDSVDAKLVTTKNASQRTVVCDNEDVATVKSNISVTNATIRLPMITGTSKPILEISNTDENLEDLFVNTTTVLTAKPQVLSTSGKDTPVKEKNEKETSPSTTETSINSITANYSLITVAPSLLENEKNLTKHKKSEVNVSTTSLDVNATSSAEIFGKQEIGHSSSPSSTAVGINATREKAKTNDTLSYQPSNKTVSTAEITANQHIPTTTASNFVSSQSEPLSSTSRGNLTMSTIAKTNSSPEISTVTSPVERYSVHEDYSSITVLDSETTRDSFSSSTETEKHLSASTIKKNLLPMPVTTAIPVVVTLEKSKTSTTIRNFTTDEIKSEKSLPSESPSQSTRKANSSSDRPAAPIGEYSSTLSSATVYTVASVQLTSHSATNAPIAGVGDNEKKKLTSLDNGVKFATSEKPTEKKYEISNSTVGLIFTSGNSTVSSNTKLYVDERSTTTISANKTNFSNAGERVNEIDISKYETVTEKINHRRPESTGPSSGAALTSAFGSTTISTNTRNYVEGSPTTAIVGNERDLSREKQPMNKTDTSKDETIRKKNEQRDPNYDRKNSTVDLITIFSSATISTSPRNFAGESSTTVIIPKATNSPGGKLPINKNDTSKDTSVTERINYHLQNDTRSATDENKNTSNTTGKLIYTKNPLHAGSPSGNHISRDFKHGAENNETNKKNGNSEEIILYETGGGAKSGNEWRPHIVREPPIGNNIRRFDKYPPSGRYGYQRLPSPATTKPDANVGSGRSAKWPFLDRTNLLRSRKRGSANADIEKQFRAFYREGKIDPSTKSRIDENHNSKIMIQCKNV